MEKMCPPCAARACGSCTATECACLHVFQAWQTYHSLTVRPLNRRHDTWEPEGAAVPPHHAYTGRHERYLEFELDRRGRRVRRS